MPRLPRIGRKAHARETGIPPPNGTDGDTSERGRGAPVLTPDRCVASGACARVCPTGAITLDPEGPGSFRWRLDYGACILCSLCIAVCEPGALLDSGETHLAARDRAELVAEHLVVARPLARPPAPGESYRHGLPAKQPLAE